MGNIITQPGGGGGGGGGTVTEIDTSAPLSGGPIVGSGVITMTAADFITFFKALDLSTLPSSDPGGGKPWLNGNVVSVGST